MKNYIKYFLFIFTLFFVKNFAFASNAVVLNTDKTLDYYEDDNFISTLKTLANNNYKIYNSGLYYYLLEDKENRYFINKCEISTNKCVGFHTPYGRYGVIDFQLFDNGTGFVLTKDGKVDYYVKNKFINTIKISNLIVPALSYTGNAVYFLEHGEDFKNSSYFYLNKCLFNGSSCNIVDTIEANSSTGNIFYLSFRENGKGFVMSKKGKTYYYENDKKQVVTGPDKNIYNKKIMYTIDALYVFNMPKPEDKIPNFVIKCDDEGSNCFNAPLNNPLPLRVSYH